MLAAAPKLLALFFLIVTYTVFTHLVLTAFDGLFARVSMLEAVTYEGPTEWTPDLPDSWSKPPEGTPEGCP